MDYLQSIEFTQINVKWKHVDQHSDQRSLEIEHVLSDREWSEIHRLDED